MLNYQKKQSRGLISRLLEALMKVGLLLMKTFCVPLTKSVLIPLVLTAADTGVYPLP